MWKHGSDSTGYKGRSQAPRGLWSGDPPYLLVSLNFFVCRVSTTRKYLKLAEKGKKRDHMTVYHRCLVLRVLKRALTHYFTIYPNKKIHTTAKNILSNAITLPKITVECSFFKLSEPLSTAASNNGSSWGCGTNNHVSFLSVCYGGNK